jgi:menaquinone-dependent protoporphyrinogen oxidase
MRKVLLIYSTVDGHTRSIVERMAGLFEELGHSPVIHSLDDGDIGGVGAYDRVVVGASIRYGKHRPNVTEWINANAAALTERPSVFFSVNLVARKPGRDTVETNQYVRKFLDGLVWRPRRVAIFAGKLDYPKYGFVDRQMIRLIMLMTGGPTNADAVVEYTDWDKVEAFVRDVAALAPDSA